MSLAEDVQAEAPNWADSSRGCFWSVEDVYTGLDTADLPVDGAGGAR